MRSFRWFVAAVVAVLALSAAAKAETIYFTTSDVAAATPFGTIAITGVSNIPVALDAIEPGEQVTLSVGTYTFSSVEGFSLVLSQPITLTDGATVLTDTIDWTIASGNLLSAAQVVFQLAHRGIQVEVTPVPATLGDERTLTAVITDAQIAVPLPASAWAGLALLAAVVGLTLRRRAMMA